jgi:polysaccharide export outer membrane protein
MSNTWRTLLLLLAGVVLPVLGGCTPSQTPLSGITGAAPAATNTIPPPPVHRLGNGEKIRVTVFGEPQLSGEFEVDGSGQLAMPLIGQVPAGGQTPRELEASITSRLKGRYLVDPKVNVEVTGHRPIYVIGEVKASGEYPYKAGLNVVSAVALAGGYSPRASANYVFIKRADAAAEQEVPALPTIPVYPGDLVRVPERYF